jgi:predicted metal-dependent phosphoesterase TrpH
LTSLRVIDLHTHTTASDGRCPPAELVARAARAGVDVLSVTDHDTVAGCEEAAAACADAGIRFVPGVEITAVMDERDVHVLGYFIDLRSESLQTFLLDQRQARIERIRKMVGRLAELGMTLDADEILRPSLVDPGKAPGRPWIARALVDAGYVTSTDEAFGRWLTPGRPAYVLREGARPDEVFERIHDAGGIASLAHPGSSKRDDRLDAFASAGLDAIEAYHSDHDPWTTLRYIQEAARLQLAISGGSDFHGNSHGPTAPGTVSLPVREFERLVSLAALRRHSGPASARRDGPAHQGG